MISSHGAHEQLVRLHHLRRQVLRVRQQVLEVHCALVQQHARDLRSQFWSIHVLDCAVYVVAHEVRSVVRTHFVQLLHLVHVDLWQLDLRLLHGRGSLLVWHERLLLLHLPLRLVVPASLLVVVPTSLLVVVTTSAAILVSSVLLLLSIVTTSASSEVVATLTSSSTSVLLLEVVSLIRSWSIHIVLYNFMLDNINH